MINGVFILDWTRQIFNFFTEDILTSQKLFDSPGTVQLLITLKMTAEHVDGVSLSESLINS